MSERLMINSFEVAGGRARVIGKTYSGAQTGTR
ncbi:uncharacterized protein METZ01_LOCUS334025 [marine metagenome]|uniref:Uncharacterized protein n=1 Tax=marine metagenome TaxID=408172 RepID=A0A382QAC1_9ZZZZ